MGRCKCRRCRPPPLRGTDRNARAPPRAGTRSVPSGMPTPSSWVSPARRTRSLRVESTNAPPSHLPPLSLQYNATVAMTGHEYNGGVILLFMPRPTRPRRKYAPRLPPEQRREQLLDAAMTVLGDCQLHELSMEAVAEAAGVGKPVLYTVFRTRTELVSALLSREHQRGLEQVLVNMPDDLTGPGPTDAYASTVSAFLQVVLDNPARWRLILTMP